jgi:hypothetical protein
MWKDTGINAVVAITGVIWIIAVAWLISDALWPGLSALSMRSVGRHKKARSSKVCDLPHSGICLVGRLINARNAGRTITQRVVPYFRPTVGGSLWGVTRSGPFFVDRR